MLRSKNLKYIFIAISIILISACGSSSGNGLLDKLSATWVKGENGGCIVNSEKNTSSSTSLTIGEGYNYARTIIAYSDSNCQNKTITSEEKGSFTIVKQLEFPAEAIQITQSVDAIFITWHSEISLAEVANKGDGYCNINNWTVDEAKEVTNKTCFLNGKDISVLYRSRKSGEQNQDRQIMKLEKGFKTLYFGKETSRAMEGSENQCLATAIGAENTCFPSELDKTPENAYHKKS